MATDPEFLRRKYRELMLGVILMEEEQEAKQLGITVDELMECRRKEQVKAGRPPQAPGTASPGTP